MARRGRGYMTVEVDLHEALQEMTDEMILEEAQERKLTSGAYSFDPMEELQELHQELLRNRPAEALAILERLIRPKWHSTQACEADLKRAKTMRQ